MTTHAAALLDTDTLSEVMKGRDPNVEERAREYLSVHRQFQFSIITRYEILRGLKAKDAYRQADRFEQQCRASTVLPLDDAIVVRAAEIYALLRRRGKAIGDADILIAATAQIHGLLLVTGNPDHFGRIPDLAMENWRRNSA